MENRVEKPVFWDEAEVADVLRVSMSTLRRWRSKGEGPPFIKMPTGPIRYEPDAVGKWMCIGQKQAS